MDWLSSLSSDSSTQCGWPHVQAIHPCLPSSLGYPRARAVRFFLCLKLPVASLPTPQQGLWPVFARGLWSEFSAFQARSRTYSHFSRRSRAGCSLLESPAASGPGGTSEAGRKGAVDSRAGRSWPPDARYTWATSTESPGSVTPPSPGLDFQLNHIGCPTGIH